MLPSANLCSREINKIPTSYDRSRFTNSLEMTGVALSQDFSMVLQGTEKQVISEKREKNKSIDQRIPIEI